MLIYSGPMQAGPVSRPPWGGFRCRGHQWACAVYGVDRMQEGFDRGIFLLFCVMSGHVDVPYQVGTHKITWLPPVCSMWEGLPPYVVNLPAWLSGLWGRCQINVVHLVFKHQVSLSLIYTGLTQADAVSGLSLERFSTTPPSVGFCGLRCWPDAEGLWPGDIPLVMCHRRSCRHARPGWSLCAHMNPSHQLDVGDCHPTSWIFLHDCPVCEGGVTSM